jgi:hypothetical protein
MTTRTGLGWILGAALFATAALLPSCSSDDDDDESFVAVMTGNEEVPPVASTGNGLATFDIEDGNSQIDYEIAVDNVFNVLFAHIHVGDPGVNGPIIFNLATAPFEKTSGTLTPADLAPAPAMGISNFADALAAIRDGRTYANVHTTQHPGGEVRGQIIER